MKNKRKPEELYPDKLTKRELETVQALIRFGGDYKKMATEMVVELSTIKTHIHRAFQKLRVNNKLSLLIEAHRMGLIKLPHQSNTMPKSQQEGG